MPTAVLFTPPQEPFGLEYVDTYDKQDLPDLHSFVDFVVCLGGDGLLLHAASLLGPALPPVISFKLGSLGFLTTHRCVTWASGFRCLDFGVKVGVGVAAQLSRWARWAFSMLGCGLYQSLVFLISPQLL